MSHHSGRNEFCSSDKFHFLKIDGPIKCCPSRSLTINILFPLPTPFTHPLRHLPILLTSKKPKQPICQTGATTAEPIVISDNVYLKCHSVLICLNLNNIVD